MKPLIVRLTILLFVFILVIAAVYILLERRQQNALNDKQPSSKQASSELQFAYYGGIPIEELRALVAHYNRLNEDGTTVELMDIPRSDYHRFINMHMIAGNGPDILSVDEEWKTTYFLKNWLADITSELQSAELPSYNDWALQYGSFNGVTYSIPHAFRTTRLIYNKELFQAAGLDPNRPPATLKEVVKYATQISASQIGFQRYGYAWPLGDSRKGFVQSMEVPLTYSGLSIFDYTTGSYDLSGYDQWFETMIKLKKNGGILPGEMSLGYDSALTQFAKGNVGMMIVSSSEAYRFEHELDVKFEWGVSMPPVLEQAQAGQAPLILLPEPLIGVNNASQNKEQAIKFWRYLQSTDTLKRLYQDNLIPPYSRSIRSEAQVQPDGASNFKSFYPTRQEAFYPPQPVLLTSKMNPNQSIFLDVAWNNRLAAYTESITERMDIQDALALETKRLNLLLQTESQKGLVNVNSFITDQYELP